MRHTHVSQHQHRIATVIMLSWPSIKLRAHPLAKITTWRVDVDDSINNLRHVYVNVEVKSMRVGSGATKSPRDVDDGRKKRELERKEK